MGYLSGIYVKIALQRDGEKFINNALHQAAIEGELPTNEEEIRSLSEWLLGALLDKLQARN